jgi:hypothetical protein
MIIEGDDGLNSDHTTFIVSCCLQMVVLIFKNGLIVKMNGREGKKKTKLGFGYKTQDIIRVEDGSWKMRWQEFCQSFFSVGLFCVGNLLFGRL